MSLGGKSVKMSKFKSPQVLTIYLTTGNLYSASVSKVMVDENNIAISSSYDHSLLIWNLSTQAC